MKYPRSPIRLTLGDPYRWGCEQCGYISAADARDRTCRCGREAFELGPLHVGTRKTVARPKPQPIIRSNAA